MSIERTIVEMVQKFDALEDKSTAEAHAIVDQLRLIGSTAAFFGGYAGMIKLHDAAERIVGSDNSVGYYLNRMWDGIGGWCS